MHVTSDDSTAHRRDGGARVACTQERRHPVTDELTPQMLKLITKACEQAVSKLMAGDIYRLLPVDDFVKLAVTEASSSSDCREAVSKGKNLEDHAVQAAKAAFNRVLYEAFKHTTSERDEQAQKWVRQYLYRIASGWLYRKENADDVVQQTLAQTLARLPKIKPTSFLGYATTVLGNELRHRPRGPLLTDSDVDTLADILGDPGGIPPHIRECVLEALARLPNQQWRMVMVLEHYAGLKSPEIAQILQIDVNYVFQIRNRAKHGLKNDPQLWECIFS